MDLFGTAGIRGGVEERVTPSLALAVGRAVGAEIRSRADESSPEPTVVLARDGRVTGPALAAAMEAGLAAGGVEVRRAGRLPTPALAHASRGRYGVMLTASHNPPTDNGIKLFRDGTEFDRDAERAVEERVADEAAVAPWDEWTEATRTDPLDGYLDDVREYAARFGAPLDGLRVAVDCGNGMSAPATPTVLRELGADVVTLNGNVDGHFPGRGSKPTPETLADLRAFVADANEGVENPGRPASHGSDGAKAWDGEGGEAGETEGFAFGIGHDGDADRIVIVDADGEVVHEDTVLAVLAERYTRESDAADPVVVTTPNASGRIDERVRAAGGRVERVRLGALHEGIAAVREDAAEAGALGEAGAVGESGAAGEVGDDTRVVFAAEPWKHIHVAFGGWIDGVASAAVIARLVADEGLEALRAPITERPYRKVSVSCPDDAKETVMDRLETALPAAFPEAAVDTDHGVRLEFEDASWTLVRPSGTEPYVRVYAESDDVDDLVAEVEGVVEDAVAAA
ncbi:phosphoglucomutase/phosphomannomutase alpha/beta/alpha domain I [Halorubrum distributum]|uniref:Phosphoglucomutase/phosphomannomutase alpha/beta/alpha domain I n=3 Tax=Halorubrum distributum TaxID=29283 RepID=M0P2P8_9EURY|nr:MULTISPECIES: phosphoglucomutase/phosphomannomutase alpha/beta/alpha domain I [Halorubrum distributum group]EMA64098.1 phosphoglucomutase/phosphomannomutase alpha/beta/alpha domain I [Halorubrum litoreum JCM 13561]EMA72230.1 phosphoglucomutase/phosphomannomutase alpha/beta/alpha domain I [Halorubrum arcis JCM 13916]MYL68304.1 phosphomannomutase [Halorubrum terrestre]